MAGAFHCAGSKVVCPFGQLRREGQMVGLLVAVGIATLLSIVLSVGYAVALRELRQINANFERLIELVAVSRRHDKPSREAPRDIGEIHKMPTGANFQLERMVVVWLSFTSDSSSLLNSAVSVGLLQEPMLAIWSLDLAPVTNCRWLGLFAGTNNLSEPSSLRA